MCTVGTPVEEGPRQERSGGTNGQMIKRAFFVESPKTTLIRRVRITPPRHKTTPNNHGERDENSSTRYRTVRHKQYGPERLV